MRESGNDRIWSLCGMDEDESVEKGFRKGIGRVESLDHAAAIMFHLGNWLFAYDKKIRVTIERDPEKGEYMISREILP